MKPLNRWFSNKTFPEPLRSERRSSPGLAAYHWIDSIPKLDNVRNISASGVYLLTQERWDPGTIVSLTLQRTGPPEERSAQRITRQARAVRSGGDGVGLSFLNLTDLDQYLWNTLLESTPNELEPGDVLREFRMAEALSFLNQICPSAGGQVKALFFGGLSNLRVLHAVEMTLKAEYIVSAAADADAMRAHPKLVLRIVEDGSWADEEWILHMWAGLLAACCSLDENDESKMPLIDIFSQLAATHVHLLVAACKGCSKAISEDGTVFSQPFICSRDEIVKLTGWHDMARIERDLGHMTDLGLLQKNVKSAFLLALDEANITPSPLALQLNAYCSGYRGAARDFYGLAASPPESAAQCISD